MKITVEYKSPYEDYMPYEFSSYDELRNHMRVMSGYEDEALDQVDKIIIYLNHPEEITITFNRD